MLARDIQAGDEFHQNGELVYIVETVRHTKKEAIALIRVLIDGGDDYRYWNLDTEVPLTRPKGV